jgi:hypothetical protein
MDGGLASEEGCACRRRFRTWPAVSDMSTHSGWRTAYSACKWRCVHACRQSAHYLHTTVLQRVSSRSLNITLVRGLQVQSSRGSRCVGCGNATDKALALKEWLWCSSRAMCERHTLAALVLHWPWSCVLIPGKCNICRLMHGAN